MLRSDVFLTLYYLQVKLGRLTKPAMVTKRLTDAVAKFELMRTGNTTLEPGVLDLIVGLEGACRHLLLVKELSWDDSRRIVPRLTVGHLVRSFSICRDLPYNSYDLATLSDVSNQNAPALMHLSMDNCSVFRLAPQCFNFHDQPGCKRSQTSSLVCRIWKFSGTLTILPRCRSTPCSVSVVRELPTGSDTRMLFMQDKFSRAATRMFGAE